jgi:hypothetical protein
VSKYCIRVIFRIDVGQHGDQWRIALRERIKTISPSCNFDQFSGESGFRSDEFCCAQQMAKANAKIAKQIVGCRFMRGSGSNG